MPKYGIRFEWLRQMMHARRKARWLAGKHGAKAADMVADLYQAIWDRGDRDRAPGDEVVERAVQRALSSQPGRRFRI